MGPMADDFLEGVGEVLIGAGVAGFLWSLGAYKRISIAPLRCPKCDFSLRGMRRIARFCPNCATELIKGGYCQKCQSSYPAEFKFCPRHGTSLQAAPKSEPTEKLPLRERVLTELKKRPQGLSLAELAKSLGIKPGKEFQGLAGTVGGLVREGRLKKARGKYRL